MPSKTVVQAIVQTLIAQGKLGRIVITSRDVQIFTTDTPNEAANDNPQEAIDDWFKQNEEPD